MASTKFFIKGESDISTIHVRFFKGRDFDLKRATPFKVSTKHWNKEKQQVRAIAGALNRDEINTNLQRLRIHLEEKFIEDYTKGALINSDWLKHSIKQCFGQESESNLNHLVSYGEYFISRLPKRINNSKGGELGVSKRTIQKYRDVVKKIQKFDSYRKRKIHVSEVNLSFRNELIDYLYDVEKLSQNTIGRFITFVKTICRDAKLNGVKTHIELDQIKGFKKQTDFIYLNEYEIRKIFEFDFSKSPYLDNARDWFIVGLLTGQRVSDFMSFMVNNIIAYKVDNETVECLEFVQKKTGMKTIVPLHSDIKFVLEKNGNQFPRKISEQRFNDYIKEVCKQVGLTEEVKGAKINPATKRKEKGIYPKFELVSSHICRRSFATNHYGKLATPVLMSITGHTTEKMFLNYIGKTQKDHAIQLKEYWDSHANPVEVNMKIVKDEIA